MSITFHALAVRPYWVRAEGEVLGTFVSRREAETFKAREELFGGRVFDPSVSCNGLRVQW